MKPLSQEERANSMDKLPRGSVILDTADKMVRNRIEQLSDKILNATDEAGAKDGMTVSEVVGCLEMCKASVIAKAFEPMP